MLRRCASCFFLSHPIPSHPCETQGSQGTSQDPFLCGLQLSCKHSPAGQVSCSGRLSLCCVLM